MARGRRTQGGLGGGLVIERHKAKALGAARLAVEDDLRLYRVEAGKRALERVVVKGP